MMRSPADAHRFLIPLLFTASVLSSSVVSAQITSQQIVGYTAYDLAFGTGGPRRLVSLHGRSYLLYIQQNAPTDLPAMVYVSAIGTYLSGPEVLIPRDSQATNVGGIDVWEGGALDGIADVAIGRSSGGSDFFANESGPGQGGFAVGRVAVDSSVTLLDLDSTGLVILQDWAGGDYRILRSTDFGSTFTVANAGVVATTPLPGGQRALASPVLCRSADGMIVMGTTLAGKGRIRPLGTAAPDSADLLGYFASKDSGTTWQWTTITQEGSQIFQGHFYLPASVSQFDFAVDDSEVVRCVFNGYNLFQVPAPADSFRRSTDLVYWDKVNGFRSVVNFDRSLPILEQVLARSSGTALGCSYPSIAITGDAETIYITWSQPNFNEMAIDTGANGFMMYDLWLASSHLGYPGVTGPLTSTPDRSELFGTQAPKLDPGSGSSPIGRILYIADGTDGCAVLGQGTANAEPVVLESFLTWIDLAVRVEGTTPHAYRLEQNFPNPFNPTTIIRFSIPETGGWHRVSIEVYDILGRHVGTIVYKDMQPGNYQKVWDAGRLASGVYFCVMRARPLDAREGRSFTGVRRMLVLR